MSYKNVVQGRGKLLNFGSAKYSHVSCGERVRLIVSEFFLRYFALHFSTLVALW